MKKKLILTLLASMMLVAGCSAEDTSDMESYTGANNVSESNNTQETDNSSDNQEDTVATESSTSGICGACVDKVFMKIIKNV